MIFVKKQKNNSKNDFWIGFSDLMTGLMLVFIILSLTFMAIAKQKIDESEKAKIKVEKLLEKSEKDKFKMKELLESIRKAKEELEKKQKNIIVILSEALFANNIEVEYDAEKGTVTIAQDILFDKKQYKLKPQGKEFINLFSHILDKRIFSKESYAELIKYIHIEGYASKEGTDEYNFKLSFYRAQSVWFNMTNKKLKNKQIMKEKLNIVSRGEIEANQNKIDKSDRKVVFRFEFYDTYNELFKGLSR